MQIKLLALSTLVGLLSSTAQADEMPNYNLGTGELLIPKVQALSGNGDSLGVYQVTMQQATDALELDFVVTDVTALDSEPSNTLLARLFLDNILSRGEVDVADQIMADDVTIHRQDSFTPDFGQGPEAVKQIAGLYRGTFPDMQIGIHEIIPAGDKVIARFAIQGTQTGDLPDIPATGKAVNIEGIDIYRIENGKIAEFWHSADTLGLIQQLSTME